MRVKQLFARFSVIYGHIWQSQFKQEDRIELADKEWSETLKEITDENMELAFSHCKKRYEMPPTLPGFYQLCRQYQPIKPSNYFVKNEEAVASFETNKKYVEQLKNIFRKV